MENAQQNVIIKLNEQPLQFGSCVDTLLLQKEVSVIFYPQIYTLEIRSELFQSQIDSGQDEIKESSTKQILPLKFQHSDTCLLLNQIFLQHDNLKLPNKTIQLAVCCLLRDQDNHILLTQRASHLQSFPKCWVTPGGHVDEHESLQEAMFRQVEQEIGLDIRSEKYQSVIAEVKPFLLYQSAYPTACKSQDDLRAHILIVFYTVQLNKHHNEIELQFQKSEVECATWVPSKTLIQLVSEKTDITLEHLNLLDVDGNLVEQKLDPKFLSGQFPNIHSQGIGEGHIKAFRSLYEQL